MMSMSCRDARLTLWPADSPRLSDSQIEAALEHGEVCPGCRSFLEDDRRIARLISESVPRARAPQALRERLYTALARERAGSPGAPARRRSDRRPKLAAILLLAGVLLAVAGNWMMGHVRSESPAAGFAEDYLRRVVEEAEMVTSNRNDVAAFFARELGIAAAPPDVPGYEMRKAIICLMNGRRGGVVEYEGDGGRVSFYIIPLQADDGTQHLHRLDARLVSEPMEVRPGMAAERGLGVATWYDREHQHALVGGLPPQRLKEMAPLFACPTRPL